MKIYLISDDNVVSRKLKENIEKRSLNKHQTIIIKDCLNIDLKNCIGIIIDIIKISSIELEKFFIAFGSIPIAYFIEESNKKYLNKNSIRIYKEKINDLVVDRLIEYFERYSNLLLQYIFLKDKNSYVRVFYDKILYIYKEGNYICYVDENRKKYKKRGNIIDIIDNLPEYFVEITYHTFINIYYITQLNMELRNVQLKGNVVLPVSNSKLKGLKKILTFFN